MQMNRHALMIAAGVVGVILLFAVMRKGSSSSTASTTAASTSGGNYVVQDQGLMQSLNDFQNQSLELAYQQTHLESQLVTGVQANSAALSTMNTQLSQIGTGVTNATNQLGTLGGTLNKISSTDSSTNAQVSSIGQNLSHVSSSLSSIQSAQQQVVNNTNKIAQNTAQQTPTSKVSAKPSNAPSPLYYTAFGTNQYNSSVWGMADNYVTHHVSSHPTNAQIQSEVNNIVSLNHLSNPNKIRKGQRLRVR